MKEKKEREREFVLLKVQNIYNSGGFFFAFIFFVKVPHTVMVNVNEQENLNEFTFTAHGAFGGKYLVC